jgi:hypothetical protein
MADTLSATIVDGQKPIKLTQSKYNPSDRKTVYGIINYDTETWREIHDELNYIETCQELFTSLHNLVIRTSDSLRAKANIIVQMERNLT